MTKKEQAALAALQEELALERAMRWTGPVEADLKPNRDTMDWNLILKGWDSHTYGLNYRVEKAVTGINWHHVYEKSWTTKRDHMSGSQNSRALHSTRLRALQSARHQLWLNAQKALARVDAEIAAEQANPTPGPEVEG